MIPSLHRSSTTNTTTSGGVADTISNAANYVKETVQETVSGASKESNKVRFVRLGVRACH